MIDRFAERAASVRRRQIPPVEGEARREFIRQAEQDFRDFAMLADATAELADRPDRVLRRSELVVLSVLRWVERLRRSRLRPLRRPVA
jgi:hypothetical protein